jgi:Predicted ATPase or kinase
MALPLTAPSVSTFSVALPDEQATQRLAIDIANSLERGDLVTLSAISALARPRSHVR